MKKHLIPSLLLCLAPFCGITQTPDTAKFLRKEYVLLKQASDFINAEQPDSGKIILDAALDYIKVCCGDSSAPFTIYTNLLGNYQSHIGQERLAEQVYRKAITLGKKTMDANDPEYVGMVVNLGISLTKQSKYEEAETFFMQAKNLFYAVPNYRKHVYYHTYNEWLASLLNETKQFKKEKEILDELMRLTEEQGKKNSKAYLFILNQMATMYYEAGQYEESEKTDLMLIDLISKNRGKKNGFYAGSIINLGLLYSNTGRDKEAEQYYLEARNIYEQQLHDTTTAFYANCLYNLAMLYEKNERYDEALTLLNTTSAIDEKTIGKQDPYYALGLEMIARCYMGKGDYPAAERLLVAAMNIKNATFGKDNSETANSIGAFANLYTREGRYTEAEGSFLEADSIYVKTLGKRHPNYLRHLNSYLKYLVLTNQLNKALPLTLEASETNRLLLQQGVRYLSESELTHYAKDFENNLNLYRSIYGRYHPVRPAIFASSYDDALFYKGFLLTSASRIKKLSDTDPAAAEKFELLRSYRHRLADLYSQSIADRDPATISMLEDKAKLLEKDLAQIVAGFEEASRDVKWKDVQQKLQANEAAIEFIHYRYYAPYPTDSIMYAALVLKPGDPQPQFIPLFEEKDLTPLLKSVSSGNNIVNINTLYAKNTTPNKQKSLYELICQPLESALKDSKTVYYSPSGLLHRINLAAISNNAGQTFGDRFQLVEMGSTRQLVVPNTNAATATDNAYLAGGIRYESDSSSIAYANRSASSRSIESNSVLPFQPDSISITRGVVLDYLPATAAEVRDIAHTLAGAGIRAQVDTGFYATEESFRQLGVGAPSPRIIHLATHGYFFPDPVKKVEGRGLMVEGQEPVFKISEHPMIRSGLMMAGAKQVWLTGKHPEGQEDGILTAYEISQMNLAGTELVVLSACETGLGDIVGNEGVFGLQRAFKIAGAKYLIMSLWKVDDKSTQDFMTTFYKHWLTDKQSVPEAFRMTQREMRVKRPGAYDWAGFVLIE